MTTFVVVAVGSLGACVAFVYVVGAATLVLYRAHLLRLAAISAERTNNILVDAALGVMTTCCGCATQGVLHTFRTDERRAMRVLAFASSLRIVPIAAAIACAIRDDNVFEILFGLVPAFFLAHATKDMARGSLAMSSIFLERSSHEPVANSFGDAWAETRTMIARYGPHLALMSALAGILATFEPTTPHPALVTACALLAPLLARAVRIDAIAWAPVAAVLIADGTHVFVVVPALVVADACAHRTRAVVDTYLTAAGKSAWDSAVTTLVVRCVLVAFIASARGWIVQPPNEPPTQWPCSALEHVMPPAAQK